MFLSTAGLAAGKHHIIMLATPLSNAFFSESKSNCDYQIESPVQMHMNSGFGFYSFAYQILLQIVSFMP